MYNVDTLNTKLFHKNGNKMKNNSYFCLLSIFDKLEAHMKL